jgi:hypothetical protein
MATKVLNEDCTCLSLLISPRNNNCLSIPISMCNKSQGEWADANHGIDIREDYLLQHTSVLFSFHVLSVKSLMHGRLSQGTMLISP